MDGARQDSTPTSTSSPSARGPISLEDFVRSPFSVRCNVVKVWRQLPHDLWTGLTEHGQRRRANSTEHRCIIATGALILVVLACASFAFPAPSDDGDALLAQPVIGWPFPLDRSAGAGDLAQADIIFVPGQARLVLLWTILPTLLGWLAVRGIWIPRITRRTDHHTAAIALAQNLAPVYQYVFMMIAAGAVLMVPVAFLWPASSQFLRWCFWCFLFGESFFVPGVMWSRFVLCDTAGDVFGKRRKVRLALYLIAFVVLPLLGMISELP